MNVGELLAIKQHNDALAGDRLMQKLHKRKMGFTFDQTFNQHKQIISSIVLDAICEAQEGASLHHPVKLPTWVSNSDLQDFIGKHELQCP